MVTYRLGDALPFEARKRIDSLSKATSTATEKLLDAGYGACWLERDDIAEIVADNLRFHDGDKYRLQDWVVMPNHVHVSYNRPQTRLADIVHGWKSYTANRITRSIDDFRGDRIWQRGYFDRYIRDKYHFFNVRCYIILNPVKAGLTDLVASSTHGSAAPDWCCAVLGVAHGATPSRRRDVPTRRKCSENELFSRRPLTVRLEPIMPDSPHAFLRLIALWRPYFFQGDRLVLAEDLGYWGRTLLGIAAPAGMALTGLLFYAAEPGGQGESAAMVFFGMFAVCWLGGLIYRGMHTERIVDLDSGEVWDAKRPGFTDSLVQADFTSRAEYRLTHSEHSNTSSKRWYRHRSFSVTSAESAATDEPDSPTVSGPADGGDWTPPDEVSTDETSDAAASFFDDSSDETSTNTTGPGYLSGEVALEVTRRLARRAGCRLVDRADRGEVVRSPDELTAPYGEVVHSLAGEPSDCVDLDISRDGDVWRCRWPADQPPSDSYCGATVDDQKVVFSAPAHILAFDRSIRRDNIRSILIRDDQNLDTGLTVTTFDDELAEIPVGTHALQPVLDHLTDALRRS
jgi:REP element-mobilizing transposase RayT